MTILRPDPVDAVPLAATGAVVVVVVGGGAADGTAISQPMLSAPMAIVIVLGEARPPPEAVTAYPPAGRSSA